MSKGFVPPKCESCDQYIWNPEWFYDTGMCGPCTTGESAELFHESWIPVPLELADDDKWFLKAWQIWYKNLYLPKYGRPQ